MTVLAARARRQQLVPFAALSASYFAHIGFFNPYLSLWLKDLGLGLFTISLLTSLQALTRFFAPYAWGALSDHTGERIRLLRFGATCALLLSLGLFWRGGTVWLAVVLLLMFTNTSAMMPMSEAAMAHLVSHGGAFDARQYGRVRLWGSIGFFVMVLLAGTWFEYFGMAHFPVWTALTLLAVTLSAWRLPNLKEVVLAHDQRLPLGPVMRQPAVRWFFASLFFHVLSHISVYAFFSLYLDSLGYSKTMIGFFWGLAVVAEVVWFYTQSRWLPLMSLQAWLLLAASLTVLRMGLTATSAAVLPVLILAQLLHGITFAAHHTACIALLSQHFPGRLRGRGQALYTVVGYGMPGILGGLAGGILSEKHGLGSVFMVSVVTSLVATALAFKVWKSVR
jgi:PPP family 3-phenylpropionic acid transporter